MSERAEWANDEGRTIRHTLNAVPETLELLVRDTCRRFHDLMDAAMLISATKYGPVANAYPDKVRAVAITAKEGTKYDASLEQRLRLYRETGNTEYLVDVANFAMIEFMHPRHPKAHYKHEGNGSIGRSTIAGLNQMNNKDLTTIAAVGHTSAFLGTMMAAACVGLTIKSGPWWLTSIAVVGWATCYWMAVEGYNKHVWPRVRRTPTGGRDA